VSGPREIEYVLPIRVFQTENGTRYREQLYVREHIDCDGHKISMHVLEKIELEKR